jgi:hypothetical protein
VSASACARVTGSAVAAWPWRCRRRRRKEKRRQKWIRRRRHRDAGVSRAPVGAWLMTQWCHQRRGICCVRARGRVRARVMRRHWRRGTAWSSWKPEVCADVRDRRYRHCLHCCCPVPELPRRFGACDARTPRKLKPLQRTYRAVGRRRQAGNAFVQDKQAQKYKTTSSVRKSKQAIINARR